MDERVVEMLDVEREDINSNLWAHGGLLYVRVRRRGINLPRGSNQEGKVCDASRLGSVDLLAAPLAMIPR